jgi:hypothetical protein
MPVAVELARIVRTLSSPALGYPAASGEFVGAKVAPG